MASTVTIVNDANIILKPTSTSDDNEDDKSAILHRHLNKPLKKSRLGQE